MREKRVKRGFKNILFLLQLIMNLVVKKPSIFNEFLGFYALDIGLHEMLFLMKTTYKH